MATAGLPLLHKYVLNPDDDLQLQMTKLRYRLCVREVHGVLQKRQSTLVSHSSSCSEGDFEDEEDIEDEAEDEVEDEAEYDEAEDETEDEETEDEAEAEEMMADTVFEVTTGGLEGPQCMSSPLQSPTTDGHMTIKSDDSGIMMDESTFSMNDTSELTSSGSEHTSPIAEDKPIVNGHADQDADQCGPTAVSDLIEAMEARVPEITVDSPEATDAPRVQEAEDPKAEDKEVEDPKVEDRKVEVQRVDVQKVEVQKVEVQRVEVQRVEVQKGKVQKVEDEKVEDEKVEEEKEDERAEDERCEDETKEEELKEEIVEVTETVVEVKEVQEEMEEQKEIKEEEDKDAAATEDKTEVCDDKSKEAPEETETKTEEEAKEEEEEEEEESEEEEEEESEEEEDDRVQFVKDVDKDTLKELGMRCDNVWTALEILNTRYRLSPARHGKPAKTYHTLPRAKAKEAKKEEQKADIPSKKCIITWSCWNVADVVHPVPQRSSCWIPEPEPNPEEDENANIKTLDTAIDDKAKEIEELVKKVLADEQRKKEQEERLKEPEKEKEEPEKPKEPTPAPEVVEAPIEPAEEAPVEAAPAKKKKGNIFQRMARAVRKRFGGRSRA